MLKEKEEHFLSVLQCIYGLNFNYSPPETKKFVDLLFKTLETQVYDVAAASTTAALPHTAPTDTAPAVAAEPAPTKVPVSKQPAEPMLSESLSVANPPSSQTLSGHQVSFSILHQHWMSGLFMKEPSIKSGWRNFSGLCEVLSIRWFLVFWTCAR
jgi:hypothetical protein